MILGIKQVVQTGQAPGRCCVVLIDGKEEMQVNCTGSCWLPCLCLICRVTIKYDNSADGPPSPLVDVALDPRNGSCGTPASHSCYHRPSLVPVSLPKGNPGSGR
jgi:hypothetical protein